MSAMNIIAAARLAATPPLTQVDLARLVGTDPQYISQIERGKRKPGHPVIITGTISNHPPAGDCKTMNLKTGDYMLRGKNLHSVLRLELQTVLFLIFVFLLRSWPLHSLVF